MTLMPRLPGLACTAFLTAGLLASAPSGAGPYADDLAKCMVRTSTPADRAEFVKFLFSAMAQHPDVSSMANIPRRQMESTVKASGELIQRLLLQSCRTETQQAIHYEGMEAVFYSYQFYGQAMAAELFGNPIVAAKMKDLNNYLDADKFKAFAEAAAAGETSVGTVTPSGGSPDGPAAAPQGPAVKQP
jgi:hypothetical protein